MAARETALALVLAGGCGIPLLPTTLFYTPSANGSEPDAGSWSALLAAAPAALGGLGPHTRSSVVAEERLGQDEWIVWAATETTDPLHVEGSLIRARQTALGLEAQAMGPHVGPALRVTLRCVALDGTTLVVVESSESDRSIERSAWVFVVQGAAIRPADFGNGAAVLPVHRDSARAIDGRWEQARTVTATFEGQGDALVVHEHATEREIASGHPEIPARAVREVDRDRRLVLDGLRLVADRASLFDLP